MFVCISLSPAYTITISFLEACGRIVPWLIMSPFKGYVCVCESSLVLSSAAAARRRRVSFMWNNIFFINSHGQRQKKINICIIMRRESWTFFKMSCGLFTHIMHARITVRVWYVYKKKMCTCGLINHKCCRFALRRCS